MNNQNQVNGRSGSIEHVSVLLAHLRLGKPREPVHHHRKSSYTRQVPQSIIVFSSATQLHSDGMTRMGNERTISTAELSKPEARAICTHNGYECAYSLSHDSRSSQRSDSFAHRGLGPFSRHNRLTRIADRSSGQVIQTVSRLGRAPLHLSSTTSTGMGEPALHWQLRTMRASERSRLDLSPLGKCDKPPNSIRISHFMVQLHHCANLSGRRSVVYPE